MHASIDIIMAPFDCSYMTPPPLLLDHDLFSSYPPIHLVLLYLIGLTDISCYSPAELQVYSQHLV